MFACHSDCYEVLKGCVWHVHLHSADTTIHARGKRCEVWIAQVQRATFKSMSTYCVPEFSVMLDAYVMQRATLKALQQQQDPRVRVRSYNEQDASYDMVK